MSPKNLPADATRPFAFFVTGGTMPLNAASYIARSADDELVDALKCGELCYILNARQMGKSSLINRAAQMLRQEGCAVAQLDLTAVGQNLNASQWYYGLLSELGQQIGLEDELDDYWLEHETLGAMQRFFAAIREVALPRLGERKMVVAVDEIDAVRSITDFKTDEFFAGIRAFYLERAKNKNAKRVTFCLLGTATPAELIVDPRITPFNIGRRIELRDFTTTEAAPLAAHLPGEGKTLSQILHWTGGHPYLTQSMCRAVVENPSSPVDRIVSEMFLSHSARESEANLTLVRDRLLRADCDQFALLSLYRRILRKKRVLDDDTNPLCDVLKLSGVVRVENGLLLVRNRIYRHVFDDGWVEKHLPGVEVRRQATAFRRGIVLTAGIAGIVLSLMAGLAYIAQQSATLADQKAAEASQQEKVARRSAVSERQARADAEEQRRRADGKTQEATAALRQAQERKIFADAQAKKAHEQKELALRRYREVIAANVVKESALAAARASAEEATRKATEARSNAETARRETTRANAKTEEAERANKARTLAENERIRAVDQQQKSQRTADKMNNNNRKRIERLKIEMAANPADPKPVAEIAAAYFELASVYEDIDTVSKSQASYNEAAKAFTMLLERKPGDYPSLAQRGFCYAKLERFTDAIADYSACIALQPGQMGNYLNRARAYKSLKKYSDALQDLARVEQAEPAQMDYLLREQCLLEMRSDDEAAKAFGQMLP